LKFEKFGSKSSPSSNIPAYDGITPEMYRELRNLGIENSSLQVIADMIRPAKSYDAFKIILEMAGAKQ